MEQRIVDNRPEPDTKQYQTHYEWCQYLSSRGQLAPNHRSCRNSAHCVSSDKYRAHAQ
jgi:hypothetical protein